MTPDIAGILEDVVHQFSDPFAFFRELVQNSIDAGTGEIDIDVEVASHDEDGNVLMVASVRDYGTGMTRQVIETQLCRLFSSEKHRDLTKIGRFGIGFISVYGIEPEWVCVDTGRSGESWRVLFLPDRSYELRKSREPFEGTLVRVAKRMRPEEVEPFRARAIEVVTRWCAHVQIPVRFAERDVRQPFEIESPCVIEHEESGTRVVAALVHQRHPTCSYYNRGLLLRERPQSPWPHVKFKIDSRLLEHTLTRDDLLRDLGYYRAAAILGPLATQTLPETLLQSLERAAVEGDLSDRTSRHFALLAAVESADVVVGWPNRKLFAAVGGPVSAAACRRHDSVLFSASESALATSVAQQGHLIVLGDMAVIAPLLGVKQRQVDDVFVDLGARSWTTNRSAGELVHSLRRLLNRHDTRPERVWLGSWASTPAVVVAEPDAPAPRSALRTPSLSELQDAHLVLNCDDPTTAAALRLAATDPDLAAALLIARLTPALAADAAAWAVARASG